MAAKEPVSQGKPVTSGRELPPRRGGAASEEVSADSADIPRASRPREGIEHRPVPARSGGGPARRPTNRPDPRPMRVVYGAGAVTAMSIMAVGLVQPNWTSTADSGPTDDSFNPTDDPGAIAVLPDGTDPGQPDPTGTSASGRGGKVRHVIRYIYLKPGQTAPPGATVISASAPPPRVVGNHPSNPDPTATPRPHSGGGNTGGGGGGVSTTPRPTQGPAATPRPTPRPTPKPTTRQSGHP